MSTRPFNERLKEALASGSSASVTDMIGEAEATAAQAVKDAAAAKTRALNPLLDDAEIEAARKDAGDAEFVQARMGEAVRILSEKRQEFQRAEDQAARRHKHDVAVAVRDKAAARLVAEYPDLANRLGALLEEVSEADKIVAAARQLLPFGVSRIEDVETVARPNFEPHKMPARLTRMTLPAFDAGSLKPTWGTAQLGIHPTTGFTPNPIRSAASTAPGETASAAAPTGEEVDRAPSSSFGPVRLIPRMTGGEAA